MDLGLKGKRALVMGSSAGIGLGIAENLAAEGASVAICGRRDTSGIADGLAKKTGATVRGYQLDLNDDASVAALIEDVGNDFRGIDIVVMNGGGPPPGGVLGVEPETWAAQFRPMFLNQVKIAMAFLQGMRDRKWGRIVITSSSGAVQPIPALGISNTLRASLLSWAKSLSSEIAPDGVTVNTVLPGRIQTDRVDQIDNAAAERAGKPVEDIINASKATIPMGRYGTVDEYAKVCVFLASACASYVTGTVVRVDGGYIRAV